MRNAIVAIPLITTIAFVAPGESPEQRGGDTLTITIQVDKDESRTPVIRRDGEFNVIFTNHSHKPVQLWSEHSGPGYETLSFQIDDHEGRRSVMRKRPRHQSAWEGPTPRTFVLPAGETFAWEVAPSAIRGEREWQGVPEPNTGKPLTLTAIFEIEPTDASRKRGVWTGRIASESVEVVIVEPELQTPHEYLWADCPNQALRLIKSDPKWIQTRDEMSRTPLHLATRFGFTEVARWLLTHGADVNARAYNQFTPLHLAQNPEMVGLLVEHQADLDAIGVSGTPLQEAASSYAHAVQRQDTADQRRWHSITRILLKAGAEYDLLSACHLGDIERVRALAQRRRQTKEAMRIAASAGHAEIVKLLLEHGADSEDADYSGLTISYFAIEHADVLKLLFDAGADPKIQVEYHGDGLGPQGSTLLHQAAERGAIESARILLDRGLDPNVRGSSGATPLHVAARNGQTAMVEWLLRNNADATARTQEGWTAMGLAATEVRPDADAENLRYQAIIQALQRAGVPLDVFAAMACDDVPRVTTIVQAQRRGGELRNPAGEPALNQAVRLDRREIVKLLLDNGADPDVRSHDEQNGYGGETPLLEAAFWGRLEIAEALIQHRANVNARAEGGVAPLHEAARMGHLELARLLLRHGADVNVQDDDGKTPLDWVSLYSRSTEMVDLLRDHAGMK